MGLKWGIGHKLTVCQHQWMISKAPVNRARPCRESYYHQESAMTGGQTACAWSNGQGSILKTRHSDDTSKICIWYRNTSDEGLCIRGHAHTWRWRLQSFHDPSSKKTFQVRKFPIGTHECWAGNGQDKLYKIGFPVWAVVDDATGKWLGAWVIPSNRMGHIIRYLFLCLLELFSGALVDSKDRTRTWWHWW